MKRKWKRTRAGRRIGLHSRIKMVSYFVLQKYIKGFERLAK